MFAHVALAPSCRPCSSMSAHAALAPSCKLYRCVRVALAPSCRPCNSMFWFFAPEPFCRLCSIAFWQWSLAHSGHSQSASHKFQEPILFCRLSWMGTEPESSSLAPDGNTVSLNNPSPNNLAVGHTLWPMALEFHTFQFPSDPCRPLRSWCSALAYRRYDKHLALVFPIQACTLCMESLLSSSRTQACIPCTELFLYESPRPACRLCTQRPGSIAPSHSECSWFPFAQQPFHIWFCNRCTVSFRKQHPWRAEDHSMRELRTMAHNLHCGYNSYELSKNLRRQF